MPSLTLDNRLIWFAHCPKAGGTSVEQVLVRHWGNAVKHLHWGWDIWWRKGGWKVAEIPNSPQHLTWKDAKSILPKHPDRSFALVRDPMTRMISEYRYQRTARRGTRLGRLLSHLPFGMWLRLMLWMAQRNPFVFDNHFRPQTEFVPPDAVVFQLERGLAPVLEWLEAETGEPIERADIPHSLKAAPDIDVRVDPRDMALVQWAFAVDFRRFGYEGSGNAEGSGMSEPTWVKPLLTLFVKMERCGKL